MKIEKTQFEKMRFIKGNKLKLTQVELFLFFHFKCVAANASENLYGTFNKKMSAFLYLFNLSFYVLNFIHT